VSEWPTAGWHRAGSRLWQSELHFAIRILASPLVVFLYSFLATYAGGDEVDFKCWEEDSEIKAYMKDHNISAEELQGQWLQEMERVVLKKKQHQQPLRGPALAHGSSPIVSTATNGTDGDVGVIVWEEAFNVSKLLSSPSTVYQVWKDTATLQTIAGLSVCYFVFICVPSLKFIFFVGLWLFLVICLLVLVFGVQFFFLTLPFVF
jgi:hypothetical protein